MTESDWLSCNDPQKMLEYLRGKVSVRKLRLVGCACARHVWHLLESKTLRDAVELLEGYADEGIGLDTLQAAQLESHPLRAYRDDLFSGGSPSQKKWLAAYGVNRVLKEHLGFEDICKVLEFFALAIAAVSWESLGCRGHLLPDTKELSVQADHLRDIVGSLIRPSPPLPPVVLAWNDRLVPRLARAAYDERRLPEGTLDTARLGILADALLDSGCSDEKLMAHLRSESPHVRGCFAIDTILGKS